MVRCGRRVLAQHGRLPADVLGQCPDDLAQCSADEVVGAGRLAIQRRHDQVKCLGLREDDRRQPRSAPEPVTTVRATGRLDGDARLPEDSDVPARGSLRDTQPRGEFVGRRSWAGLEDLEGTQGTRGGAQIGRHSSSLGDHIEEPEAERPEYVLA